MLFMMQIWHTVHMSRQIILASTSPRRRELLERACIKFTVESPEIEEDMNQNVSPSQLVKNLALAKASAVAKKHPKAIVIAADTIVALGGKRWSKPKNETEAQRMLRALSGKSHDVWTAFCIIDTKNKKRIVRAAKTRLSIRKLSPQEIDRYIATGEPLDGAGGYKMQETGGFVIGTIKGDYTNVLGLPLGALLKELKALGVR